MHLAVEPIDQDLPGIKQYDGGRGTDENSRKVWLYVMVWQQAGPLKEINLVLVETKRQRYAGSGGDDQALAYMGRWLWYALSIL